MQQAKLSFEKHLEQFRTLGLIALVVIGGIIATAAVAQEKEPKTFSTPEEASHALYTAAKSNDERTLIEIFGRGGK